MPKGQPKRISEWIARKTAEQAETVRQRTKLLPDDLAQQIIEGADREIAMLVARVEALELELEGLDSMLKEVRAEERAACAHFSATPRPRSNWRGEIFRKDTRIASFTTPESIAVGKRGRAISRRIQALQNNRALNMAEIAAVQRVRTDSESGIVTALLHITQRWRNRVNLSALNARVPLGRSSHAVFTDAAGYPLPEEALDTEGQPLQHKHRG